MLAALYVVAGRTIPDEPIEAEAEQIIVSLGAPAQRLDPPPPELIPDEPPDEPPLEPQVKTERAEEAPPPEAPPEPRYYPPVQQATGALSSGFGEAKEPAPPSPPPPPPPRELSRSFINLASTEYVRRVQYPFEALRRHDEGNGAIKVELDRSGRVLKWELVQSTGSNILDREIIRVANQVEQLDPLPPDYPYPSAKVIVPFSFIMAN